METTKKFKTNKLTENNQTNPKQLNWNITTKLTQNNQINPNN
jgi:transcriptional regulator CtsR